MSIRLSGPRTSVYYMIILYGSGGISRARNGRTGGEDNPVGGTTCRVQCKTRNECVIARRVHDVRTHCVDCCARRTLRAVYLRRADDGVLRQRRRFLPLRSDVFSVGFSVHWASYVVSRGVLRLQVDNDGRTARKPASRYNGNIMDTASSCCCVRGLQNKTKTKHFDVVQVVIGMDWIMNILYYIIIV